MTVCSILQYLCVYRNHALLLPDHQPSFSSDQCNGFIVKTPRLWDCFSYEGAHCIGQSAGTQVPKVHGAEHRASVLVATFTKGPTRSCAACTIVSLILRQLNSRCMRLGCVTLSSMHKGWRRAPFNFSDVGITNAKQPHRLDALRSQGWVVQTTRSRLGSGRRAYEEACRALHSWAHFCLPWAFVDLYDRKKDLVLVVAQCFGLWSINPLRITHVQHRRRSSSLAHTTLQGHQISGEERFSVEWDAKDDSVWYEIYTVSKPATLLSKIGCFAMRACQRAFVTGSTAAMQRAVVQGGKTENPT